MEAGPLLYGEEVEVFVRPEDVELYPLNDPIAGCFEAQIVECR
jgi:hypothetical protein